MTERYGRFSFRYCNDVESSGKIRVYIQHQPDYEGRVSDSAHTHRLFSGGGAPPHVCIKEEFKPRTLEEAQELARRWAACTENYIRTGRFREG